jgi:hypothetical protein
VVGLQLRKTILDTETSSAALAEADHVFVEADAVLCSLDPTLGIEGLRIWEYGSVVVDQVG